MLKLRIQIPTFDTGPFAFRSGQHTAVPSFRNFVTQANPRYRWFPHVEQLAAVLEQVASGDIKRLMVFLPPRHGKSELVSRLFSAYYLYCYPDRWVGINSYSAKLAYTFSRNARENYKRVGGIVSGNAAAVEHWETDQGGGLWAAGVGGSITGKGFHLGIIDDPLKNAEEAASETIREKHKEWYDSTFYTREEPGAAIIVIQTRWHEDDLSGYLLDKENEEPEHWTIVNFPAVKEIEHYQFPATCTVIPDTRQIGDPLAPARYPLTKLNKIENRLGDYFWSALYQQRPKPKQGATFKGEWWLGQNRYDPDDRRVGNRVIGRWLSFDTGLKDNLTSDYSACTVLEMLPDYTLTVRLVWRARLKFPMLVSEIADMARTFNRDDKLRGVIIEDKVSGTSAYQTLSASSPEWLAEILIAYNPQGAKEYRHELAAVWCKRDCILLPMPAESVPWLLDFERELFSDTAAHDDMKDSFTQGILYLEHYIATGWHARVDPPPAHTRPADFAAGKGKQHDRVRQALIEAGYY